MNPGSPGAPPGPGVAVGGPHPGLTPDPASRDGLPAGRRGPLALLSCCDGEDLAIAVGERLGVAVTPGRDVWFASGEAKYVVGDNVRGCDCYLFQRAIAPGEVRTVYDRLGAVLHAVDALRHADAARVTLILPYLPGSRQDKRKNHAREGVSTNLFARLFRTAGVSMVVTVDPHNEAIVGAYDPATCVLEAVSVVAPFAGFLAERGLVADVVASTDVGGLELARKYAHLHGRPIAALSKERDYSRPNTVANTTVIGEVRGRSVLIVDDIVDTAGSVDAAVRALWDEGATDVVIAGVHLLLCGPGVDRMVALRQEAERRGFTLQVAGTSSVRPANAPTWIHWFGIEPLLASIIHSVNTRGSVRALE
ncbi:MAG: ribose-phosphate diphosphokinase [Myxococcota bacterium]